MKFSVAGLLIFVAIVGIGLGVWRASQPDTRLVFTDGLAYSEDDGKEWHITTHVDPSDYHIWYDYATWDEVRQNYRYIFGGNTPTTIEHLENRFKEDFDKGYNSKLATIKQYAMNVIVCRVLRANDGTYIVLRKNYINVEPTWTTWSPELWDIVNKAQKLVE